MHSSVITFPGSNCDRDMDVALKKFGFKNKMVWHDDVELPKSDLVVLPGGFSYGDYLRCGSMASKSKIMKSVLNFAQGVPFGDILLRDGEFLEQAYLDIGSSQGYIDQQAFLGYYGGVIDPESTDESNTAYISNANYSSVNQEFSRLFCT